MLFISDLDKTLLNAQAKLSAHSKATLKALLQQETPITIATARSGYSAQQIMEGLDFELPVILYNGAIIASLQSGENHYIQSIDPKILQDVLRIIQDHGCTPLVSSFKGKDNFIYHGPSQNAGMDWFHEERQQAGDPRLRLIKEWGVVLDDAVIGLTVINKTERIKGLYNTLMDTFPDELEVHHYDNPYSPGWEWMAIHHIKATKKEAILKLVEHMGQPDIRLTVFGDNVNDISMFEVAHHKIAVANAMDELKAMATEIIGHHETDAVVEYIARSRGQ